jgi:hypothetical protein
MEEPYELADGLPADAVVAQRGPELDSDDRSALGPLGQRLLLAGILLGVIVFFVLLIWLLGYLAYTRPPVPGAY